MASTHVTDAEIDLFRGRQLPASDIVTFTDHLESCGECRARVAARGSMAAALAVLQDGLGIGVDDHVPEHDIRAFVDGILDPERCAEISAHLAGCAACAEEVRDLSDFAAAFPRSRRPSPWWTYGTLAAAAALILAVGAGLLWRGKIAPVASVKDVDGLSALSAGDANSVRTALASGLLSLPPALADLRGQDSPLMGAADAPAFSLESPIATKVLDTRPTLRWTALPGSPSYTVTLLDEATGATIDSPPLRSTEWTPDRALGRGQTYAWQVAASSGGKEVIAPRPPSPPVRFMVADAASATRLDQVSASPLVRGVLFANSGLLDDAEREFRKIGPSDQGADRANTFLAQLRAARAPVRR